MNKASKKTNNNEIHGRQTYLQVAESGINITLKLAAIIGAIILIASQGTNAYRSTIGQKSYQYLQLNKLSATSPINFFESVLGQPQLIHSDNNYKTYIFAKKEYFVTATTKDNDEVAIYSITTRDKNFNPEFDTFAGKIKLGVTNFSQLNDTHGIVGYEGASRHEYNEIFWGARPGAFQNIIVSLNDSGVENYDWVVFDNWAKTAMKISQGPEITMGDGFLQNSDPQKGYAEMDVALKDSDLIKFRKTAIINTISITEPNIALDDPKLISGVYQFGMDQVDAELIGIN